MRRTPHENVATVLVDPCVLPELLMRHRGDWDLAADWTPVWIGFGSTWRLGDEPLPWAAHERLWKALDSYVDHVRFRRELGGVNRLTLPELSHR